MKKYIGFLVVLSIFVFGGAKAQAISTSNCVTASAPGFIVSSLDIKNPVDMTIIAGANNVEVLRINLSNTSTQNVCLNGIQLGSSENLNNFINNTKIIDVSTGLQVGQIAYSFTDNGSYYYSWVYPNPSVSIQAGATKIFKVVSDFPITAQQGDFKIGFWGLNFDSPGSHVSPSMIEGNKITVTKKTTEIASCPTVGPLSLPNPFIKVISPNGGETYTAGQQITIKWNSCFLPISDKVIVVLDVSPETNDDGYNMSGSDGIINDGVETFTLESDLTPGKYKIRILDKENNSIVDSSDNYFAIYSPSVSDGCSNGEKYSSTTGQICTLYGCLHGEKYSSTTGKVCPVIPEVVDNGCNGTLYSTTTGKLCGTCSASGTGCYKPSYVDTKPILIYPLGCTSLEGVSSVTGASCKACSISGAEGCFSKTDTDKVVTPLTRILKIGAKGEDVKLIQELLGVKADGIFGNMTANKVKEWQASKDLKVDGVFGPASFQKINSN